MVSRLYVIIPATLAWLAAAIPAVSAERYPLESQFSLKTTMMPPPPLDEQTLELDVDQAIIEIAARKRDEELIREIVLVPRRRPDLDYAVTTGIQARNIENARRRQ